MISYNTDYGYAQAKLCDSLVRLGRIPIIVREICSETGHVSYTTTQGDVGVCTVESLNLEPVPLGYVNQSRACTYTARIPARHWRQGLRANLLHFSGRYSKRVNLNSPNLVNTILNNYPTMSDCFEAILNEEVLEKAFSRNFALGKLSLTRQSLLHKTIPVGEIEYVNGGFSHHFASGYSYLQEAYQEAVNVNNP